MAKKIGIVNCAREIGPGSGVASVAHALDRAFKNLGVDADTFTLRDAGLRQRPRHGSLIKNKFFLLLDVVYFSIVGTLLGVWKLRGKVAICHNDTVFGKIYVNHGLHRAMVLNSRRALSYILRNPIHLFLLIREWIRFNFPIHKYYVCFSNSEKDLLEKSYPKAKGKVHVIPNGVDVVRFRPDRKSRVEVRQELGIAEDDFVLAFVGHEFSRKGLTLVLAALCRLPEHVKLLVAGGSSTEIAKARAEAERLRVVDRVHFLGVVPTSARIINASDALVLPSEFESWGLVGLEAMGCGIPALMTPTGGIPDYLVEGKNGLYIERDPAHIAAQVKVLLENPALLCRMKYEAQETAQRFAWENVAKRYVDLAST